jgi:two-component system chemotaxis response regulator CheB
MTQFRTVVIGVSASGLEALTTLLPALPADLPLAVIVAQHRPPESDGFLTSYFDERCRLPVTEADEKELVRAGHIYFAAAGYHLLIEGDESFSLSVDEKVHFARPSIDVLFESAALAYGDGLIGVVLTGANEDGAAGLQMIRAHGGLAVVQDPASAETPYMPQAAIAAGPVDYILTLSEIAKLIKDTSCLKNMPKY